jgi:glycosyltransferase involved in cell wall biosynthesis
MRIAQIAPLHEAVPPKLYGGTERVVSYLTEELVALGHQVTLFASGDSVTSACLHDVWPRSLRLDPAVHDVIAPHMLMMEEVRRRAEDFDVLHFHLDYWPFSMFTRQKVRFVTTLHGRLDLPERHDRDFAEGVKHRLQRSAMPNASRCRRLGLLPPCRTGCRKTNWRRSRRSRRPIWRSPSRR